MLKKIIVHSADLLKILSDGEFHSGQTLGQALDVSRASVWKAIQYLQKLGVVVYSVRGKGYRLKEPVELLSEREIKSYMSQRALACFSNIDIRIATGSTNADIQVCDGSYSVCMAELQTAGKGRRGRVWFSPFAKNIAMSLLWQFPDSGVPLDGLSLCVGVAVARAIKTLGITNVALKWPNDLYCDGRKIAGILIEIKGELSGSVRVVIGIGVNVSMAVEDGVDIDQPWTALSAFCEEQVSRNRLTAEILNEMTAALCSYQSEGFGAFIDEWSAHDFLYGREVSLMIGNEAITGIAKGVNEHGALLVESTSGIRQYSGGEVTVRSVS